MRFWRLILILVCSTCLCSGVWADEPRWAQKAFHPDTLEHVFVVGVGIGSDELSALRESRRHALANLIQSHFADHAKASLKIVEGTHGVLVEDRISTAVYDIDLTRFEKVDQVVELRELPFRQITVKSLYRFPKALIEQYRQSKREGTPTEADEAVLQQKMKEASLADDERQRARIEGEEIYRATYPLLGMEMDFGYLKVSRYSFLAVGVGIPLRLRPISDRIVLRPFATFGFGDSNKVEKEQSNDADSLSYTSSVSLGADLRLFLYRGANSGFYLIGQAAQDRVSPTCRKTNSGRCLSEADAQFTQTSYSGGFGFVIPSRHPIGIEMLYGVPDHRLGIGFKLGLPFLK